MICWGRDYEGSVRDVIIRERAALRADWHVATTTEIEDEFRRFQLAKSCRGHVYVLNTASLKWVSKYKV